MTNIKVVDSRNFSKSTSLTIRIRGPWKFRLRMAFAIALLRIVALTVPTQVEWSISRNEKQ